MGAVAKTLGCALWGLETALVTVEADVANGLPHFAIVGLPDTAVQEARERVRAAIRNAGFEFPLRRVIVLAPRRGCREMAACKISVVHVRHLMAGTVSPAIVQKAVVASHS